MIKMKLTTLFASAAAMLCLTAQASTTLTAWNFDNLTVGANATPLPSAGFGAASALGFSGSSNPDIQTLAGSSTGGAKAWRVRATGVNTGWSTNAGIGSQGAKFTGSTAGYYKLKVLFDVYATADAEANLQVQYSPDGTFWYNAANLASAGAGVVTNNSDVSQSTVIGGYVKLASGWNNQIAVDLGGISAVDNNPNFAVRIVNASTGSNCVDTTGSL